MSPFDGEPIEPFKSPFPQPLMCSSASGAYFFQRAFFEEFFEVTGGVGLETERSFW